MKRVLIGLTIAVFGLLVGLALLEVGFRAVSALSKPTPEWSDRPRYYFKAEASSTLQDYAHDPVKPADVFRIAVVGDSYSFAPYMQFTDAFPKKLEQMLNLNETARRAEVINYGVPAYSTSHEVAVVARALEEGADLILLQVTLNDPELKPYVPTGINLALPDKFGALKLEGTWGWIVKHWKSLNFVLTRLHNSKTHREYIAYFRELFENPRGLKKFKESLAKIGAAARSKNVKIVAFVFPLFGLRMDESYPLWDIHDIAKQSLDEAGIPNRDLSSIYRNIPLERLQVWPGVDRHPNEIAHRMAAEAMYDYLIEQSLVPEELRIRDRFTGRTDIVKEQRFE